MNKLSIVITTYNRPIDLKATLSSIFSQKNNLISEVIVVDNNSDEMTAIVLSSFSSVKKITLSTNIGAVARNYGILSAENDIVVCLDDDVHPLFLDDWKLISALMEGKQNIAAISFKVLGTNESLELYSWCHPRDPKTHADKIFYSDYLSEGACAIRKSSFVAVGGYWEKLFIAHEGEDLVLRLLDNGYDILYYPEIKVVHYHSNTGRPSWRAYYYNHRNNLWIIWKNYRLLYVIPAMVYASCHMLFFSLRSFHFLAYLRAWKDALIELPLILEERKPIKQSTHKKLSHYRAKRPHIIQRLRRHILNKVL
ncbi:glycosyltransferase family 2 protein [Desulfogranum marinum]|uniref:glycosyltransferase family 2 protein n=1 Tax=Desulfogranum marinum TaxID=453220 RepID=UPI0029C95CE5|nr:glycosyltransferase family 2 protein [Desulfogranum marinum]